MVVWKQVLELRMQGDTIQGAVSNIEAAIYRFLLRKPGQLAEAYVGETVELKRRVYHYMNPGPSQQTNIWLHGLFQETLRRNGTVVMETLELSSVPEIGDLGAPDLQEKYWRRLLEAFGCLEATREGFRVLNR